MISKKELNDDELENVEGGYLYPDKSRFKWQVIDDKDGRVLEEFNYRNQAEFAAQRYWKVSTEDIDYKDLCKLRGVPHYFSS